MRASRRFRNRRFLQAGLIVLLATGCSDVGGPEPTSGIPASGDAVSLSEIQKLLPGDGGDGHWFGRSVALDGDVMIVGARFDESAYLFRASGGSWTEMTKVTPPETEAEHQFGYSVDVDGDVALVGEMWDDENGSDSGSAYVVDHTDGGWSRATKLTASDGGPNDLFGFSVVVEDDVAVVGAVGDESAYVFERSGGTWSETAKLTAADGGSDEAAFGGAVALSEDVVIVGAQDDGENGVQAGAAYVFESSGGTWSRTAKLMAADGATGDRFGGDVAVGGDVALVGAWADDDEGSDSGSTYVFEESGGVWSQTAKLTAADGATNDRFGGDVAVEGSLAVIAAGGDGLHEGIGAAYVFDGRTGWSLVAKLAASDGGPTDFFGSDVAVSGEVVLVGAMWDDDQGPASGSAYVFDLASP